MPQSVSLYSFERAAVKVIRDAAPDRVPNWMLIWIVRFVGLGMTIGTPVLLGAIGWLVSMMIETDKAHMVELALVRGAVEENTRFVRSAREDLAEIRASVPITEREIAQLKLDFREVRDELDETSPADIKVYLDKRVDDILKELKSKKEN